MIPQHQLKRMENMALRLLNFSLFVQDLEWHDWLKVVRGRTAEMITNAVNPNDSSVNHLVLSKLDELLGITEELEVQVAVQASPLGLVLEKEITTLTRPSAWSHQEDDGDDIILIPAQPVASLGNSIKTALPAIPPARWDARFDSPLNQPLTVAHYDPVQRPFTTREGGGFDPTTQNPTCANLRGWRPEMMHSNVDFLRQQSFVHRRFWNPTIAAPVFNAPHPSRLGMFQMDQPFVPQPQAPSLHLSHPGIRNPNVPMSTHCRAFSDDRGRVYPHDSLAWHCQFGQTTQAFVAGGNVRLRT